MKKILFAILVCILLLSSFAYAKEFPDVASTHWAYNYINELSEQGVINGYEDGTYRPNGTVTYAEFIKLMICTDYDRNALSKNLAIYMKEQFPNWYDVYFTMADDIISYNYEKSWEKPICRLEMAKIMKDFAEKDGILFFNKINIENAKKFSDTDKLSTIDIETLLTIRELGLITGYEDNTFRPSNNMSRAEVATIIYRYMKLLSGGKIN